MINDMYGQQVYTEEELCDIYMRNPDIDLKDVLTVSSIQFNDELMLQNLPTIVNYVLSDETIEEFDQRLQSTWYIPEEYKTFDIAKFVLEQCTSEAELQRAGEELLLFQERNMFILLQYLKYMVDTMRQHNIVWGVGRGSSVSSFVLYLIGIHRINSLYYDLDINEFLK